MSPTLSSYFSSRQPSDNRLAQMEFAKRTDNVQAINVSVGNVSLPMHPAMQARMKNLGQNLSFAQGIVQYSATVGYKETQDAFLNIIASSGASAEGLYVQITDGGSQGMELILLGMSDAETVEDSRPVLVVDPVYSNYTNFAKRLGRRLCTISRTLSEEGEFTFPSREEIEAVIQRERPNAFLIIPYDNPTGQLYDRQTMIMIAELCVQYSMWLVSDEAYRELFYTDDKTLSIWHLTDELVPGIQGRRISIETVSKVWNACGLRIGALVTDNKQFHEQSVAENTAGLCSNVIGQYIAGALAHESVSDLQQRYDKQRSYYGSMTKHLSDEFQRLLPGVIVSRPDASLYSIIDVRNIVDKDWDAKQFALFCAREGSVKLDDGDYTLLVSPMQGFYADQSGDYHPGRYQMRIAFVESPERMQMVPSLFVALFARWRV